MTGYKVTYCYISCDGKDCGDESYGNNNEMTLTRERRAMHKAGWRRVGREDYCPKCAKKMGLN